MANPIPSTAELLELMKAMSPAERAQLDAFLPICLPCYLGANCAARAAQGLTLRQRGRARQIGHRGAGPGRRGRTAGPGLPGSLPRACATPLKARARSCSMIAHCRRGAPRWSSSSPWRPWPATRKARQTRGRTSPSSTRRTRDGGSSRGNWPRACACEPSASSRRRRACTCRRSGAIQSKLGDLLRAGDRGAVGGMTAICH